MPNSSVSILHRISNLGVLPEHALGKARYIRLVNQISLFVGLLSLGFIMVSYEEEPLLMRLTELASPFICALVPYLNYHRHPKIARGLLYFHINLFCFLSALFMGSGTGEHLYFMPVIFGTALIFDLRKWKQLMLVLSIPLIALATLYLLNDSFAARQQVVPIWQQAYGTNLVVSLLSGFVLALFYYWITFQQQRELKNTLNRQAQLNQTLSEKEKSLQQNLKYSDLLMDNLKSSKNYFESLIQNAADIICVTDEQGAIRYLTPSFYRLTGYKPENLKGRKVFDFVHPDDLEDSYRRVRSKVKGSDEYSGTFNFRYRKADGQYLYLEANGTNLLDNPAVNGLVINARDVTERAIYHQQLERKEHNIRSILDNNPSIIWMVDTDYRLLDCNTAFKQNMAALYGLDIKRGDRLMDLLSAEQAEKWTQRYLKAKSGVKQEYIDQAAFGDTEYLFRVSVNPVYTDDKVDRFTVFAEDITAQKQAEAVLVNAKEKAEEASQLKAQFVSTMSHELRTPMNAILGMTHLLMQESPRPDQSENLRLLKFSAENMLNLVNDVLDFSKYESGRVELEKISFNVQELAQNITDSLQPVAKERKLQLRFICAEELPNYIIGDPARLSQVLSNLLSNAIKFTEEGSVTLSIRSLHQDNSSCKLQFSVQDTGIGIAPDKQQLIFESFTQAEASTTRQYGGTGLGLAISKKLLNIHNSDMSLESVPGKGSTFTFAIEYIIDQKNSQIMTQTNSTLPAGDTNVHLLLVEDNPLNRFVTEKFLNRWGFSFKVAETGQEALNLLENEEFGLILMDLQLPDIDGYEVTRELRNSNWINKEKPVMAMSASTEPHIQAKAYASGMQEYLIKPFNPDNFKKRILELTAAGRGINVEQS